MDEKNETGRGALVNERFYERNKVPPSANNNDGSSRKEETRKRERRRT